MTLFKEELDQPHPQMKESEETYSYGLTTDGGLHHKLSVVSFVSTFLCSFFLSQPSEFGGVHAGQATLIWGSSLW